MIRLYPVNNTGSGWQARKRDVQKCCQLCDCHDNNIVGNPFSSSAHLLVRDPRYVELKGRCRLFGLLCFCPFSVPIRLGMKRKTFSSAGPCLDATAAVALVFLAGMVLEEEEDKEKREEGRRWQGRQKGALGRVLSFFSVGRYTSHVLSQSTKFPLARLKAERHFDNSHRNRPLATTTTTTTTTINTLLSLSISFKTIYVFTVQV